MTSFRISAAIALGLTSSIGTFGAPAAAGQPAAARPVTLWVLNEWSGSALPINTATKKAGKPIKVDTPFAEAITPDGRKLYVSGFSNLLTVNTATGRIIRRTKIKGGPAQLAMLPDGRTVYVVSNAGLVPINVATGRVGRPIKVNQGPDQPEFFAVTPDSKILYAVDDTIVIPVNTRTNKPGKPIKTGYNGLGMLVTPNGKTGYVLGGINTVIPVNLRTAKAGKPIRVGPYSADVWAMAITPDGKTVYAVNRNGTVVPITTATNRAGKPIKIGGEPDSIAITPNGKTAYVTTDHAVYPINIATNKAGKPITAPRLDPAMTAITPDGKTAWITSVEEVDRNGVNSPAPGFVLPVSTKTNRPGKPIKVGEANHCLVIRPWHSGKAMGPLTCG
ncbi:MAG TPA: YncE family protein [Streptosporangiaceae bacterium]|nr:YncE family protein [Streptosporangiaceae bacterium]